MAFQPIVDIEQASVFAYEALVRPLDGRGGAAAVLEQITPQNRYAFDQACRARAIQRAARLEMQALLSVNFLPNAVYSGDTSLERTFEAAAICGFPPHHLILEVSETEPAADRHQLRDILDGYKRCGMMTALDDFGAGHSGLNMLAEFQPDIVKLDMALTRNVHEDRVRRAIVNAVIGMCRELGISVIAEGIETLDEALALRALGIRLFQGYLFARPAVECLPGIAPGVVEVLRDGLDLYLLGEKRQAAAG
jgi:EAL domain-containing protein (putative c-di-GMP-specific phosphodiesterase class I)